MSFVLPRIQHNVTLWNEFSQKNKLLPSVKSVGGQLESTIVDPQKLKPFGYNPSIIAFGGRLCMAYRTHVERSWMTTLWMAQLDEKFNVIRNDPINLAGQSNEDPRLFVFKDSLHIGYVSASGGGNGAMPTCSYRYGRLVPGKNGWEVEGQYLVRHNKNGESGIEKNWVPFDYNGRLNFIYSTSPSTQTVIEVQHSDVIAVIESQGARWKWGPIRGGTTPINYKDKWLRFFHSRLDNESAPNKSRYYIGAMLMEKTDPFTITAVSSRPILIGSEVDALTVTARSSCHHHKPNVVFPAGIMNNDKGMWLSVGVNDCLCYLVNVPASKLNL